MNPGDRVTLKADLITAHRRHIASGTEGTVIAVADPKLNLVQFTQLSLWISDNSLRKVHDENTPRRSRWSRAALDCITGVRDGIVSGFHFISRIGL